MPGSPQWNARVGKRPRAFPERRGVPAKHHMRGHHVTVILPGFSLWSRVERGVQLWGRWGVWVWGGAVGSGQCQGENERTARGWSEDKGGSNNAAVTMQPVKWELIEGWVRGRRNKVLCGAELLSVSVTVYMTKFEFTHEVGGHALEVASKQLCFIFTLFLLFKLCIHVMLKCSCSQII